MSAETIATALGGHYKSGRSWRCRCPSHHSSGGTLAVRDTPAGGVEVRCFAGCRSSAVMAELRRRGLAKRQPSKTTAAADPEEAERQRQREIRDRQRRIQIAGAIWRDTVPANYIVQTYLGSRLILLAIPPTIRLHWSLRHKESGGRRPAMVGLVQHATDGPVGVHCTYLAADGSAKACVEPVKRFIGPVGGGAVQLAPVSEMLAVTEGIESGLSYMETTGTPTWSALSAGGIRQLILPAEVRHVIIAADSDPVGIMAARAAARRWLAEGRRVSIARPPVRLDFNDMARVVLG